MNRTLLGAFNTIILLGFILIIPGMVIFGFLIGKGLTFLLVGIQAFVAFTPLVRRIANKTFDVAEPGLWFSTIYFVHFGLRALFDLAFGSSFLGLKSDSDELETIINNALLVSTIGLVVYSIGYYSHIGIKFHNSLPQLSYSWKSNIIFPTVITCLILGWVIRLFIMYQTGGSIIGWLEANKDKILREVDGITYLLTISNALIPVAFFVFLIHGRTQRKQYYTTLFYFIFLIEILFSLFSGSRSYLGFLLIQIVIAYYMTSNRGYKVNIFMGKILVVFSIGILALFPLLTSLRVFGLEGIDIVHITSIASDSMATFELIGDRFHGLDSLALIMQRVPTEIEYSFGKDILLLFISWIPRAVWADKPVVSLGKIFREQMNLDNLFGEGASISITLPGHFYMSFGFIGVIVGMLFIGIFWRFLHEYLVKPKNNLSNSLVVSVMFFSFFLTVEQTYNELITYHFFRAFIVVIAILPLAYTRKYTKQNL